MDQAALIPVIWWGLVAVLVVVAAWFFWSLRRQRQGTQAHFREQLEIIEYFSQSVFRQNSTEDILWDIAASCIEKMGLEDCVIYLRDEDKGVWVQKAAYGPKNVDYRAIHEPMELAFGQGIVGRVGASGIAEIVSSTASDADYVVDDALRGSEMAVPIVCDGEVIGVIDSEHTLEGFFQSYHLRLLQSVANICGQKIGRSIGEERIQEFAKFFQLNPNPVARLDFDGVTLLSNAQADALLGVGGWNGIKAFKDQSVLATSSAGKRFRCACSGSSPGWRQVVSGGDVACRGQVLRAHVRRGRDRSAVGQGARSGAERHKSDFLSVMSHEIRTPLNAILGLIELMMRGDDSEQDRLSNLSYMEFAGKHLKGLLTDVLDLERLDSGKAGAASDAVRAGGVFQARGEWLSKAGRGHRERVEFGGGNGVPARLMADVGWLTQMLNNLITNALKFTSEGEVRCHVAWESERLEVEVRDTGRGISPSDLKRILEPFEQADRERMVNTANQGVGLGLAITKKLVGLHGGELGVTSTLGEGTTFRFALPLQRTDASEADVELQGETPDRPLIPDAPVLIVDDNELNVLVARRMVANWGYDVITASNADEAEAQLAQAILSWCSSTFTCQDAMGLRLRAIGNSRQVHGATFPLWGSRRMPSRTPARRP